MRILIDALAVLPGVNGGAATYVGGVVNALTGASAEHQYFVVGTAENRPLFATRENLTFHEASIPAGRPYRLLYEQFALPCLAKRCHADVIFFPGNLGSLLLPWFGIPSVVTIHDGSPDFYAQQFPGYFPRWKGRLQKFFARQAARHAVFVLTNSHFAGLEVAAYADAPPERIVITLPGCPRVQPPSCGSADLARQYGFQTPYVFMLGSSNKHKNFDAAVHAFLQVKRSLGLPHHLVIAGVCGNGHADLVAAIRHGAAEDCVHLLGYVPSGHLTPLFRAAELFVMPSLYEGFGFPVLEAMELGVPTLLSSRGSLPEVGGDAAMYFDGRNIEEMTQSLALALSSPGLRSAFAAKGKARAAQFSWELMARQVLDCCARACSPTLRPIREPAQAQVVYQAAEQAKTRSGGGPDV